jgi:hypothetical protein
MSLKNDFLTWHDHNTKTLNETYKLLTHWRGTGNQAQPRIANDGVAFLTNGTECDNKELETGLTLATNGITGIGQRHIVGTMTATIRRMN